MINLYLFRCDNNVFTHALQHCFMLGRKDLYDACCPVIDNGLLSWKTGPLITSINSVTPFRQVNWADYTNELDFLVNNNLIRSIATYRDDQVLFLQQYLQTRVSVITVTYTQNEYDIILDCFVRVHLHRQQSGLIPLSEQDQQLRQKNINLFDYYRAEFDKIGLVPKNLIGIGNYNVPAISVLNEDVFFQHLVNIGGVDNQEVRDFYRQWRAVLDKYICNAEQLDVGNSN